MANHNTPLTRLPAIPPGHFLVLHGEQGSGKSTLARRIAAKRGKYAEITSRHLSDTGVLAEVLSNLPSTLIIDVEWMRKQDLERLKSMITADHVYLRPSYKKHVEKMPVPPVIVCAQDVIQFIDNRRAALFLVRKDQAKGAPAHD